MDRERKLLFTVALLAPVIEGVMFATYYHPDMSARTAALVEEARSCQQQLFRAWAQCDPKHFRRKDI